MTGVRQVDFFCDVCLVFSSSSSWFFSCTWMKKELEKRGFGGEMGLGSTRTARWSVLCVMFFVSFIRCAFAEDKKGYIDVLDWDLFLI